MKFPVALSFDDVLLVPQRSEVLSRSEVSLKSQIAQRFLMEIPIIATNMDTVTGIKMAVAISRKGGVAFFPRFDSPEIEAEKIAMIKKEGERVFATVGFRDGYLPRAELCLRAGADGLHFDVAHGHTTHMMEAISDLKNRFPRVPLVAGVVATFEGAYDLFVAGADCVRVGVGAGSICTTRVQTGFGVPQVTAISETVRAKKRFRNRYLIVDGGMKNSGDIVKALALGADAVSLGSMLAGTEEAPGEAIEKDGVLYKEYNGSTSAREKQRQIEKFNGQGVLEGNLN